MATTIRALAACVALVIGTVPAQAEFEISYYMGLQEAMNSRVRGNDPENGGPVDFNVDWEGYSTRMPPYYGFRATWWRSPTLGWGLEFTHDKVYASAATLAASGYSRFELTDGLNIVTFNVMRRWPNHWGRFTPYVGGGIGVAIPHVDITPVGGTPTLGYQVTGGGARWTAGIAYEFNDHWAAFGEYQGTYSHNQIDLANGGSLTTAVVTHAINIGVSYRW